MSSADQAGTEASSTNEPTSSEADCCDGAAYGGAGVEAAGEEFADVRITKEQLLALMDEMCEHVKALQGKLQTAYDAGELTDDTLAEAHAKGMEDIEKAVRGRHAICKRLFLYALQTAACSST